MRILQPTTISDAKLTASDVPENEYAAWASGVTYAIGDTRIYNHRIYESLANSNFNYTPSSFPAKWLDRGATNRWKMFDAVVGSRTSQANAITVSIMPGGVDAIAFLDVKATSISVTMTDPVEGVVYEETIDLVDGTVVVDGYTYFFSPIVMEDAAVLLGIPPYANATITVTISLTGGTAEIGTLAVGVHKELGLTLYNPTLSITDYSKKDVDTFGNYYIIQRAYSKRMSCDLWLPNENVDDLHRTLSAYRTTPVIWIGSDDSFSSMIIYGFYKSFRIVVPYPTTSTCSLEIEGLS